MSHRDRPRMLRSLGEVLGLDSDSFISAMKEAVWVPGAVDQLADVIARTLSLDDIRWLLNDLPEEPEMMALVGRLLLLLNDQPDYQLLAERVRLRAQQLGPTAQQFFSSTSWYPPVSEIARVLVTPTRLQSPSMMMRMQWGANYQGIEVVWLLRFDANARTEAYFISDASDRDTTEQHPWQTISRNQAVSLLGALMLARQQESGQMAFDGMVARGLWLELCQGKPVKPWIDAAYALQSDPLSIEQVAIAAIEAADVGDFLAVYSLFAIPSRDKDILSFLTGQQDLWARRGRLWRLAVKSSEVQSSTATVVLQGWFRLHNRTMQGTFAITLMEDRPGQWKIRDIEQRAWGPWVLEEERAYCTGHPRYWAQMSVEHMGFLGESMPGLPIRQRQDALYFAHEVMPDYRVPYDLATRQDLGWIVLPQDNLVVILASDEILLHRDIERLRDNGSTSGLDRTGIITFDAYWDLWQEDTPAQDIKQRLVEHREH